MALMATSFIGIDSASDETLVRCLARKDERAMRVLFARHYRRVFSFLIRIVRDETLAEDVELLIGLRALRRAAQLVERVGRDHVAQARITAAKAVVHGGDAIADDHAEGR